MSQNLNMSDVRLGHTYDILRSHQRNGFVAGISPPFAA